MERKKILFVCTSGSRAEAVVINLKGRREIECKSAGVYSDSGKELRDKLEWADIVCSITLSHHLFLKNYFKAYESKFHNLNISEDANNNEIIKVAKNEVEKLINK